MLRFSERGEGQTCRASASNLSQVPAWATPLHRWRRSLLLGQDGPSLMSHGDLFQALRKLKRDFEMNVVPALRRHVYHLAPGERRRQKSNRARKAAAK